MHRDCSSRRKDVSLNVLYVVYVFPKVSYTLCIDSGHAIHLSDAVHAACFCFLAGGTNEDAGGERTHFTLGATGDGTESRLVTNGLKDSCPLG